jgi:hypothetical protein
MEPFWVWITVLLFLTWTGFVWCLGVWYGLRSASRSIENVRRLVEDLTQK